MVLVLIVFLGAIALVWTLLWWQLRGGAQVEGNSWDDRSSGGARTDRHSQRDSFRQFLVGVLRAADLLSCDILGHHVKRKHFYRTRPLRRHELPAKQP